MAITLKEETILNQWSTMVDQGAGQSEKLLADIERRLDQANIPGGASWNREEVQSSGWFSKVKRELVLVTLDQFKDYRMYIGARDYGVHLDVCRFLTVEPGFFKKAIAEKLSGGDWSALSAPKNVLVEQDLTAYVTVVHHCVVDAVAALMGKLGQDPGKLRRESKGILEIW